MLEKACLARCGVLYKAQNRHTKAAPAPPARPGFTEAVPINRNEDFVHESLTSQLMGAETPQPHGRKFQNTIVNSHWLNSRVVHLYTAEIKGMFIQLKVRERAVIQRLHSGFLNDNGRDVDLANAYGWWLRIAPRAGANGFRPPEAYTFDIRHVKRSYIKTQLKRNRPRKGIGDWLLLSGIMGAFREVMRFDGGCGMSRNFLDGGEGRAASMQVNVCGMLRDCQVVRCGRGSCGGQGTKDTGRDCF